MNPIKSQLLGIYNKKEGIDMLKLGIIGTGPISKDFIEAARLSKHYEVTTVYSRTLENAKKFAETFRIEFAREFHEVGAFDTVDVVYIGTPNSSHFYLAQLALKAKKHVIVEKPSFSNEREWNEIHQLAKEQNCFVFEAARHVHEKNFQITKQWVQNHMEEINGAVLTFAKYSSKYDAFLEGNIAPVFTLESSGGSIADLGVYPLYAAIAWFGEPKEVHYFAKKLHNGIDGTGIAILRYPRFDVTLHTGKIINSHLKTEIYAGKTTLVLDAVNITSQVDELEKGICVQEHGVEVASHYMLDEVIAFAKVMESPNEENLLTYNEWTSLSHLVIKTMDRLRRDAHLVFYADKEK